MPADQTCAKGIHTVSRSYAIPAPFIRGITPLCQPAHNRRLDEIRPLFVRLEQCIAENGDAHGNHFFFVLLGYPSDGVSE